MPDRRVIVSADDLGLCAEWDAAIFDAIRRGVVTSTSIVATGPTYERARRVARAMNVDVGVHLDLLSGTPLSPAHEIASLVDRRGAFLGQWQRVVLRSLRGALVTEHVEREWARQIARTIDDGLAPTHLDGHYHLHLLPQLWPVAERLARRFGIGVVRVPDERPRNLKTAITWTLTRRASSPRVHCRGLADAGRLGVDAWTELLRTLPTGVTEIVCHPGQSPIEDAALRSPELRDRIARHAQLTSFRSLAGASAVHAEQRP